MGTESIMYVLVGTCWIAGTVYFEADSPGTRPLGSSGQKTFFASDRRVLRLCIET